MMVEIFAWSVAAFVVGLAIGTYRVGSEWDALVDSAHMNGKRYRLMFLEASENYWRTRAELGEARGHSRLAATCTEAADEYKSEADALRSEVTP